MSSEKCDEGSQERECPFCDGEGWVKAASADDLTKLEWKDCPMCRGTCFVLPECTCVVDEAGYHIRESCPVHGVKPV